ncbi:serine/threonine-protein kinase [Actinoplanes sp. OR16]|uniref:serine/threonine-protein kinase n=1 Tax=Actinoplanes sp. OR16 TaxID=946334 RepID=UPI000FD8875A|nr:serine/threonine-protein kinase [Actinoplanes sp. OR16]
MDTGYLVDGRFRLRDRLGTGGMAVVWRAGDEVLGRDVALKILDPRLAHDPALLARVRDEARAVARLRHPNIVNVYDYGEAPGPLPYVVMEIAEGRSLSHLLSGGPLPWRVATLVAVQVAAALAAAHDADVVHRDVKPGNVMVGGGRVKLVDFGISAATGDDDLAGGQLLGTPAYLAPERLEDGVVRPATDVYALGLLLYRTLAGRLPWDASTTTQMVLAHRYREPDPLPPIAGLPEEVAALCRRCLAKAPDGRPAAAEVAALLAEAVGLSPETLELPRFRASTDMPGGRPEPSTERVRQPTARVEAAVPADRTEGIERTTAASRSGPRLAAGAARWRALPPRRRVAALAAAGVLLSGGIMAATIPGGESGPPVEAAAPRSEAPLTAPAPSTPAPSTPAPSTPSESTPAESTAPAGTAADAAAHEDGKSRTPVAETAAIKAAKAPAAPPKAAKGKAKPKGKKKAK